MSASLTRIHALTAGLSYDDFASHLTRQEAVIRNLEIIGEAAKNVPKELRSRILAPGMFHLDDVSRGRGFVSIEHPSSL